MPTLTTNYSLNKPLVADATDEDLWGGYLNDNFDTLDTTIKAIDNKTYCITSAKTSTYTVLTSDRNTLLLCNATSGAITLNLPAAATAGNGFEITVKKTDSSANAVTIDGNASELIDGATTLAISNQYDAVILVCDGTGWNKKTSTVSLTGYIRRQEVSPVATTSGTSVDISTTIPNDAKQIVVNFNGVSTNGNSPYLIQVGNGSYVTSGYISGNSNITSSASANYDSSTQGLQVNRSNNSSTTIYGRMVLELMDATNHIWSMSIIVNDSGANSVYQGAGLIDLSSALDRIRITTVGGSNTFDSGSIGLVIYR